MVAHSIPVGSQALLVFSSCQLLIPEGQASRDWGAPWGLPSVLDIVWGNHLGGAKLVA